MSTDNHPLPAPPGQYQHRPRAKSGFSFRSNHSHKSSGSSHKIDLHETHEEKESKRLQSKADPSMALSEAEPSAVASGEKSSLAPIRAIQHRDNQGNPIADPDLSNPTRNRWERPLDTIRSFEAAIDGNYSRKSYIRTDSADAGSNYRRRSSYFGGTQVSTDERQRFAQNGYYGGGRAQPYKPESHYMDGKSNGMTRPDSHFTGAENAGPSNGYYPNRARYPRTASEPHFNNGQGVYPGPGNQQSYETVTTASGSGSSDPAGYSTDPSSENSSVDRFAPLPTQKESPENPGAHTYGNNSGYPSHGLDEQYGGHSNTPGAQRQGNGYLTNQGPPPLPIKESVGPRAPIKLGKPNPNNGPPVSNGQRPAAAEKRKSWFGKRFSKS